MAVVAAHLRIDVASSHPLRCVAAGQPGLEDKVNVASLDLALGEGLRQLDEPLLREHDQVAALAELAGLFMRAPAHPDQVPHLMPVRHSSPLAPVCTNLRGCATGRNGPRPSALLVLGPTVVGSLSPTGAAAWR